jgi:hypothetical protein
MQSLRFTRNSCPLCRNAKVVRINPTSLDLRAPTHQCQGCKAELTGTLRWQKGVQVVAVGAALMLLGVAAYEASKQLSALSPGARFAALLAFLGGVVGYSANRVVNAIEYKLWQPRP